MQLAITNKRSPIGIDMGARQIKIVQLSRQGARWRLENVAVFPRRELTAAINADEVQRVGDVLFRRGFVGRKAVLATPAHELISGVLELPPVASGAPLREMAQMELARTHRVEPDSLELAYWELPTTVRGGDATQVYAAACTHRDANEYLDLFEAQGLNVCALDVQSAAIVRACKPLIRDPQAVTAILDVGWMSARLILLFRGQIVFERTLEESGVAPVHRMLSHRFSLESGDVDHLILAAAHDEALQTRLSGVLQEMQSMLTSQYEAMAQEVRVSLTYVTHRFAAPIAQRVLLVGGGASLPGLRESLTRCLELDIHEVDASELVEGANDVNSTGAMLVTAIGLAQWRER